MKKPFQTLVLLLLLTVLTLGKMDGQSGRIKYYRKYNWSNIASKLPFLSSEERDRILLTWGKDDGTYKGEPYELSFNPQGSVYRAIENEDSHEYSWGQDEDVFVRYSENKQTRDQRELLGKLWIIEDDIPRFKWKILNEFKEVAGYVCMKAETRDTIFDVTIIAWYTDKIKAVSGPEGYSGLPGLILSLEYNTDDVVIEASTIELLEVMELPQLKTKKGKKTSYADYNTRKRKHVLTSIAGKRNPFWELRY